MAGNRGWRAKCRSKDEKEAVKWRNIAKTSIGLPANLKFVQKNSTATVKVNSRRRFEAAIPNRWV